MKFNLVCLAVLITCVNLMADAFMDPPQVIRSTDAGYQALESRKFQGISSMAVSPKGRLWAVWYAGPTPGEDKNNYVIVATSGDDGKSWKELFAIDPDGDGDVRAFDPEMWLDPQGRLWVFWAQHPASDRLNPHSGVWAMTTENPDDEAAIWSAPRRLTDGIMMCKPTVLSTGQWLLPASTWRATDNSAKAVASDDSGKTFEVAGACNVPVDDRAFDEQMIVERKDGSLWMLIRTKYGIGESVSNDGGKTWSGLEPSKILHPSARFFIRRLISGNLLLVKHGMPDEKIGRSHLMAFVSKDDGKSWQGGLLLDERAGVSYPDGQQAADGTIYITYDYSRTQYKQIFMACFTEDDILVGKPVSDKARLAVVISSGGSPASFVDSANVNLAAKTAVTDSIAFQKDKPGVLGAAGVSEQLLKVGAVLFGDREYELEKLPEELSGGYFLPINMDGAKIISCTKAGTVWFATPLPERNKDSQAKALMEQGFKKTTLAEFSLFNPKKVSDDCCLFQKECVEGEKITVGKWAVPVFVK